MGCAWKLRSKVWDLHFGNSVSITKANMPAMISKDHDFDVLVIGNGSAALYRVAVVEQRRECRVGVVGLPWDQGFASRASGAMLGIYGEMTPILLKSVPGQAKVRMAREAELMWPAWLDVLRKRVDGARVPAIRRGTYVILNSRSGRIEERHFAQSFGDYSWTVSRLKRLNRARSRDFRRLHTAALCGRFTFQEKGASIPVGFWKPWISGSMRHPLFTGSGAGNVTRAWRKWPTFGKPRIGRDSRGSSGGDCRRGIGSSSR